MWTTFGRPIPVRDMILRFPDVPPKVRTQSLILSSAILGTVRAKRRNTHASSSFCEVFGGQVCLGSAAEIGILVIGQVIICSQLHSKGPNNKIFGNRTATYGVELHFGSRLAYYRSDTACIAGLRMDRSKMNHSRGNISCHPHHLCRAVKQTTLETRIFLARSNCDLAKLRNCDR